MDTSIPVLKCNSFRFLTCMQSLETHINTCKIHRSSWPPSLCPLAPTSHLTQGRYSWENVHHTLPSLPPFVLHVLPSLFPGLSLSPLLSLSGPIHVVTTRKGRRLWPLQWKVPSLCRSCRRVGQIQADFYLVMAATECPRCSKFLCKFPVVKCLSYKNYWLMTILYEGKGLYFKCQKHYFWKTEPPDNLRRSRHLWNFNVESNTRCS